MDKKSILIIHPFTPIIQQIEAALKIGSHEVKFTHISRIENSSETLKKNYPSLILLSDAKLCLNFMVLNHKLIQGTSSKVILISDKMLPDRMIHKLTLMGFTENILSSVPIKSILYKIQLQLKSLENLEQVTKKGMNPDKIVIKEYTEIIKDSSQVIKEPSFIIPEDESDELGANEETYELLDEQTKEIVDEFSKESDLLLEKLQNIVSKFEKSPSNTEYLDEFGQVIDRMMGSAQTIGLKDFATYCQMGKIIGYKASQSHNPVLLEIVAAILIDTVLILKDLNKENKNGTSKIFKENPKHKNFISRLQWLANKFRHLERGSVSIVPQGETLEELLAKL